MIRTEIFCDRCGGIGTSSSGDTRRPAWKMRSELKYVGWLIGSLSGIPSLSGKDFCPECKVLAKKKAKEALRA